MFIHSASDTITSGQIATSVHKSIGLHISRFKTKDAEVF